MNALAYETCFESKAKRDRTRAVTADDVAEAREALIVRRVTHLDQLADKLREDRVRRVVEPMLSGVDERRATSRDIEYVRDLGLIARDKPVRIANPIYAEVVPRELGWILQEELDLNTTWYVDADDSLNLNKLMEAFPGFLPPALGALEEPVHVRGGVAADSVAGVPAPGGERGRAH